MNRVLQPNNTVVVQARAAHTHDGGVVTFTNKNATQEDEDMSSCCCWPSRKTTKSLPQFLNVSEPSSTMHTPPTKRELDDAKKRIATLHNALLDKSLVHTPDMDVEEMLSIMTRVVDEQRVLSLMYEDLVNHNIEERIATGNNDSRRPGVGAGPAIPVYSTRNSTVLERSNQMKGDRTYPIPPYNDSLTPGMPVNSRVYPTHTSTVRERVKEMQDERHLTLLPHADIAAPGTNIHEILSPQEKAFVAAHTNLKEKTVEADNAVRQALAVKVMAQKYNGGDTRSNITTRAGVTQTDRDKAKLEKLQLKAAEKAKKKVSNLAAAGTATDITSATLGNGSILAVPASPVIDKAAATANATLTKEAKEAENEEKKAKEKLAKKTAEMDAADKGATDATNAAATAKAALKADAKATRKAEKANK